MQNIPGLYAPSFYNKNHSMYADSADLKVTHISLYCGNNELMIEQSFCACACVFVGLYKDNY